MTAVSDVPGSVGPPQPSGQPYAEQSLLAGDGSRAERTRALFACIETADGDAARRQLQNQVVTANLAVARSIAMRYRSRGLDTEDLLQAAYVGLVKAVRGFRPVSGRDFLSYAVPTVSGEVKRWFRDHGWMVRPPRRIQELQVRIARANEELVQRLGRSPSPREVAEHLGPRLDDVVEAMCADGCFTVSSLDRPMLDDPSRTVVSMLGAEDPELPRAEARVFLGPAVRQLTERDRRIVELRFFRGWTQQRIAEDLGVTQMQVSRLLTRILADLRGRLAV